MVAAKQQSEPSSNEKDTMLSFVPEGLPRSIAEYVAAAIPGAILLFAFFLVSEVVVLLNIGGNLMSIIFAPVVCILPIFAGMVSTLTLEKLRKKPLHFQRGALVGAAGGLLGSAAAMFLFALVRLVFHKLPFGGALDGAVLLAVAFIAIIGIDTLLAALGGVLVVKFVKDI